MRVRHHAGRAAREHQSGETGRAGHARFDVDVGVDETGEEVRALSVHSTQSFRVGKAEKFSVADADGRFPDFPGEDVNHPCVDDEQISGAASARGLIHKSL